MAKILCWSEEAPEDGQRVFHLVMPLFPCSLRDALPKMKSESTRNAMIQMIEGLKYIHRSGFLHRDIKPENIFISEQTPTSIVLGDLGLLSPVGAVGRMAGTGIYKAPEVYYEDRQTAAIDVYALGVTFLQMLDGRACKGGHLGLKKWVKGLWDYPPPPPFSRLIMQMTAPYPPTLRPSLNTIQDLILQHKDLPKSVQRPEINLERTMKMLKEKLAAPAALINHPVQMAVPSVRPAPLQRQAESIKSRLVPKNIGSNEHMLAKPPTKKAGPLDVVHKARVPAPREPAVPPPKYPKTPGLKQVPHDSTPKPVQRQPNQRSSTHGVDFTKPRVEPGNIFARQKIELLEAELKVDRRMQEIERELIRLAEEQRNQRREYRRCRKANRLCHEPCPGQWPLQPTYPGSGSFSRVSHFSSDAIGSSHDNLSSIASNDMHSSRPSYRRQASRSWHRRMDRPGPTSRAKINVHAWHNERSSKREKISLQTKVLEGLALALKTGAIGIGNTLSKSIRWMLGSQS